MIPPCAQNVLQSFGSAAFVTSRTLMPALASAKAVVSPAIPVPMTSAGKWSRFLSDALDMRRRGVAECTARREGDDHSRGDGTVRLRARTGARAVALSRRVAGRLAVGIESGGTESGVAPRAVRRPADSHGALRVDRLARRAREAVGVRFVLRRARARAGDAHSLRQHPPRR